MKLLILFFLCIMAIQDYKTGMVSNYLYLPLLIFIKFNIYILIIFLIVCFLYKLFSNYLGGADIKIFFIFLSIFPISIVLNWLFYSLFLALVYAFLTKKREIRMFPFFCIGYLGVII
ncbi:Flp pilus assembly protein protease CpaA [Bacilli bacterium PM5-3]|nr:Flp pilus assembly protein protease CpaA [Bacilli bacterium PM5-3]MDH6603250.1 Flp pilus assembly protein protease CpaA [Bacilli bacterium PM5-9]